jgi:hypothetical protein
VSGNNYLLDTNILLYALKGLTDVRLYFDIPPSISVVIADKGFKRIKELSLILIEV